MTQIKEGDIIQLDHGCEIWRVLKVTAKTFTYETICLNRVPKNMRLLHPSIQQQLFERHYPGVGFDDAIKNEGTPEAKRVFRFKCSDHVGGFSNVRYGNGPKSGQIATARKNLNDRFTPTDEIVVHVPAATWSHIEYDDVPEY